MTKILLIQDQLQLLNDLASVLELQGFETYTASNGPQGLRLAVTHSFDIIVTDYRMPGMFGWKVAYHLLPILDFATPIILTSASHPIGGLNEYLPLFDDFLQMPFDMEDFIDMICQYTNQHQDLREVYA